MHDGTKTPGSVVPGCDQRSESSEGEPDASTVMNGVSGAAWVEAVQV